MEPRAGHPGPAVIAGLFLVAATLSAERAVVATLPDGGRVEWRRGDAPQLLVLPRAGEGWTQLAARVTGRADNADELRAANDGFRQPLTGIRVRVPWVLLRPDLRVACARALFPRDWRAAGGWEHMMLAPWGGDGESWWELAEWFCGDGSHYPALRDANPALGLYPPPGSRILIPAASLLPEFRRVAAEPPPPPEIVAAPLAPLPTPAGPAMHPTLPAKRGSIPAAVPAVAGPGGTLEYREGEAVYRLRQGEALYSAVVVRFTGQLEATDVNATAREIAKRSGIGDVTAIPVGYEIRIPFDLLLPEFLPTGHPRRVEWERDREELAAVRRVIRAANLDGIHVILDAGHGGGDTGAIAGGVWESTYVYDVMNRVKRVLEEQTKATVWLTVRDTAPARRRDERDVLPQTRNQQLLVDPPYDLADSTTGVHLRWVLENSILDRLKRQKVNPERVAFVSIHADSLHPAVRGLMVYVPSRSLRSSRAPFTRASYPCREVRTMGTPQYPQSFRSRSEALSTQLGEAIVRAAERSSVPVHEYQPVRASVLRGGSRWVPAVLRYSTVPSAVLVEVCNLNNERDRELLLSWRFREKLAHAIVAGLAEGFSR
ncbi:MAG TPA: N-acetylmuramoyl-L-alanine amidase [Thermoanaerobaculaceae bacterium]|nr:N-acetylmuramoyl-L-alanine amidase [Thermoanaerobaculaceae bacterium]